MRTSHKAIRRLVLVVLMGITIVFGFCFMAGREITFCAGLVTNNQMAIRESPNQPLLCPDEFSLGTNTLMLVLLKSKRTLLLCGDGRVLASYRVGLGFNPRDDKQLEGDGCTPEGIFTICTKNPNSKFTLSLGISYPNKEDAQRGLKQALISKGQYQEIVRAIDSKQRPPWNTPLGGEICIHGGGGRSDWTLGCIALDDQDIKALYPRLEMGMPIIIKP